MVILAQRPQGQRVPKAEVEVVITRSCQGRSVGSESMQHLELGSRVKVAEAEAYQLVVIAGAALYVSRADDETEGKIYTLTPAHQATLDCEVAMRKQRADERAEEEAFARASRRAVIDRFGKG